MAFVYSQFRMDVALAGDYPTLVKSDGAVALWKGDDPVASSTAADAIGSNTGTVVGGVTFGQAIVQLIPPLGVKFNGTTGKITVADATALHLGDVGAFECWVKRTAIGLGAIAALFDGNTNALKVAIDTDDKLLIAKSGGATIVKSTVALSDTTTWHHVVYTKNGATSKLYLDGVDVTGAVSNQTLSHSNGVTIGALVGSSNWLPATLMGVAYYGVALTSAQVAAHYNAALWTSLGRDVSKAPAPHWTLGNTSNGPLDRVAPPGLLEFSLRNDAGNTGATQSWYSPNSASCRSGWTFGIPVRVISTYQSTTLGDAAPVDRVMWRGKVTGILPDAGKYRARQVHVTGQCCMGDLAANDAIQIPPQLGQNEATLIRAVITAMPTNAQPPAVVLDAALDTYPYAFDNIGAGVKGAAAIGDCVISANGWAYAKKDGSFNYENRHTRALKTSQFTFTDLLHDDDVVPSDLSNAYNRIRVTIHPRTLDAAATTVLCSSTAPLAVAPGQTVSVWDTYRVAANTLKLIGGTAFVTPLVASTDYTANSVSDGSGTDLTASVAVVATPFAASAKFDITNSHPTSTAYLTLRQMRGKGIYDNAPITFEYYLTEAYGDRPLDIDLPFQTDPNIAQDFAAYVASLYATLLNQDDSLSFNPQRSDALMTQALTREIGDLITASEPMTGLSSSLLAILGMDMTVLPGLILMVRYVVSYAGTGLVFIFDDAIHGVFDSASSPLGYA